MFAEVFLRIFSDCCVLFAFLGCCPTWLPYSFPLLAVALICGGCAALAAFLWDINKDTLSKFCLILPLLSLLLIQELAELRILVLPILYTAVTIARGNFQQEYYDYQKFLIRSLILMVAVWAVISIVTWIEDPQDLVEDMILTEVILRYTIVHFVCGIMLQRHLRLGSQNASQSGAGQILAMLTTVGVAAAAFVLSEPLLRQWVTDAVSGVLSILISVITILFNWILSVEPQDNYQEPSQPETMGSQPENSVGAPNLQPLPPAAAETPTQALFPWIFAIAVLAAVIAVVLMFLVFTRRKRQLGKATVFAKLPEEAGAKRASRLSNRTKVRQAYRDFLRLEQKRGLVLKKQYTTQDILQRISRQTDEPAARQLRDVYIHARYDHSRQVTKAQAEEARAAVKKCSSP